jgi:hypothetical protein
MILYLINLALLLMLMASTTYMVLVNRRLRALKNGQDEIGPTIKSFARATGDMAETVTRLNTDATAVTQNLEKAIARAQRVQGDIKQTLADASAEARILARDRVRLAAGDPPRERLAPDAREKGRRSEASKGAMPDAGPPTGNAPDGAGTERGPATTRELFPTKKPDGPRSYRPWMPRRATDEDVRADAMQMFYGEPESA